MKVATFVSGNVPSNKKAGFIAEYTSAISESRPAGLEQSFLMKRVDDSGAYTIETIWESREALEAMRSSGKPKAIELFERIGVTPQVWIQEIEAVLS